MAKKYVCVSGGADSTAMALLLWERGEDFEMIFSDTSVELPENYWFLPRLAKQINRPLHVVSNGSFFQYLVAYGYMLPGPLMRWCTRQLKNIPQDRYFETVKAEQVAVGIRADEPKRLKRLKPRHDRYQFIYPLAEAGLTKRDVKAICAKYDLLNPVYAWRTSVSCFCCFFQRVSDWRGLLQHHPTLYAIAEEWERQAIAMTDRGYTWRQGYTLESLRLADEQQLRLWPEPEDEPCLICAV